MHGNLSVLFLIPELFGEIFHPNLELVLLLPSRKEKSEKGSVCVDNRVPCINHLGI